MKKSKKIKTGTTNYNERVGIMQTECKTVGEFVNDVLSGKTEGHYQFIFGRLVYGFVSFVLHFEAVFVWRDGNVLNDKGFEGVKNNSIKEIRYKDGWGGVEYDVTFESIS